MLRKSQSSFPAAAILGAGLLFYPLNIFADTANIIVEQGQCVENCADSINAVRINNLGVALAGFSPVRTEMNETGYVLFNATLSGPGLATAVTQSRVLRRNPDGSISSLAYANLPISNLPGRSFYAGVSNIMGANYSWPALLDDGTVIIDAPLAVPGQTTLERALVCLDGGAPISLVHIGGAIPVESPNIAFGLPARSVGFAVTVDPILHRTQGTCGATVRAAAVSSSPALNSQGVWRVGVDRALERVGRIGTQAPGLPSGVVFGVGVPPAGLSLTQVNMSRVEYFGTDRGDGLVHSFLEGPGIRRDPTTDLQPLNNQALWYRSASGQMMLIAQAGQPAPGAPGAYFSSFGARLFFPGSPGVASQLDFQAIDVNDFGHYAFKASLVDATGDPLSVVAGNSIWSNRSGSLAMLARLGTSISDQLTGQSWELASVGYSAVNQQGIHLSADGTVYYVCDAKRPGIDALSRKIMVEDLPSGQKRVIAWEGQTVPGVTTGSLTSGFATNFTVIEGRGVAFIAQYGNSQGIFSYQNGTLRLIASSTEPLTALGSTAYPQIYSTWRGRLPINSLGQFLQKINGGVGYGYALMDLDGSARYVIDQSGHFSQATDTRLTAAFSNNCSTYGINENSEALFNCGRFLVHYRADDAQDNPCPADVNNDSIISVDDLFAFLQLWFALDSRADFSQDGSLTVQDIFAFLEAWFRGCN